MQKPEELVEKITKEEQELDIKLSDLECFMMSADFIKVSPEQKTLLEQQYKAMTEYKLILIKRAHRINWEAGRDKAAAEVKEATERLEPHVFAAMEYEAWKKKEEERLKAKGDTPSDCPTCKWAKEGTGRLRYRCKNPNKVVQRDRCWEAKEETTKEPECPNCPFKDGNRIPKCINLRGDKCSSPDTTCYRNARKEEEDGTPSDK